MSESTTNQQASNDEEKATAVANPRRIRWSTRNA